jgi:hypothetical protein
MFGPMQAPYIILAAIAVSLVLMQINQRIASPAIAIMDRWLRWFIFTFGGAQICRDFALIDRPFWMLAAGFFLLWFLGETLYNWLAISALSASPLPLFPRYTMNSGGGEWPMQPRMLRIREWLRAQGFQQAQALRAEVGGKFFLRVSVYQDASATVRLQITFLPQAGGNLTVCYELTSVAPDGTRYVTDNVHIPFAGFYPENWLVERRPWSRSLPRLLARHRARLARAGINPVPFDSDPLTDVNAAQQELERLNTELGFLHPHNQREDHGKISPEGRYRVWKEIWMLNYLGRSARYC